MNNNNQGSGRPRVNLTKPNAPVYIRQKQNTPPPVYYMNDDNKISGTPPKSYNQNKEFVNHQDTAFTRPTEPAADSDYNFKPRPVYRDTSNPNASYNPNTDYTAGRNVANQNSSVPYHTQNGQKSQVAAILLCFMFGFFGAHRFYLGKTTSAVMMVALLVAAPTLGFPFMLLFIWWIIDLVKLISGNLELK